MICPMKQRTLLNDAHQSGCGSELTRRTHTVTARHMLLLCEPSPYFIARELCPAIDFGFPASVHCVLSVVSNTMAGASDD
jgi:hypothetical protein